MEDDQGRAGRFTVSRIPHGQRLPGWLTPAECAASKARGYIIKDLIAPCDLMLIYGGPGMGKSCLAPLLAYSIALGKHVFGRRVRKGRVLYVASEDPHGMRKRIHALLKELGGTDNLLLADGLAGFMEAGGDAESELLQKVRTFKANVVIFDTIAAGFQGLKENEPGREGMGRVVSFARELIEAFGVAVVLLHHVPKGDSTSPRGHGVLQGDADVALAMSRADRGLINASFTKNRNGPSDTKLTFSIRAIELGNDEDGDPITAPIADPVDLSSYADRHLAPQIKSALRVLDQLLATKAEPLPSVPGFPSGVRGVPIAAWRKACEDFPISKASKSVDRERAWRESLQRLQHLGYVASHDEWVWRILQAAMAA